MTKETSSPPKKTPSPKDPLQRERWLYDEQTGEFIELVQEEQSDRTAAWISAIYLLASALFFFWLMFDFWIGRYSLIALFGYATEPLTGPAFQLFAYAFIGGALGGIVNGLRSFLVWHAERKAFGGRFIWKYLIAPWTGAALAIFTFALIQSGVAVFSGEFAVDVANSTQILATFAIGVLAGYGSREAFIWLDFQVKNVFQVKVEKEERRHIPDLTGKTLQEAMAVLEKAQLKVGVVSKEARAEADFHDRVISQIPEAQEVAPANRTVNITLGKPMEAKPVTQ
jgi:hypothetical protein